MNLFEKIISYVIAGVMSFSIITLPTFADAVDRVEILLEAEDFVTDSSRIKENQYASGGEVVQYSWVNSFEPTIQMNFDVEIPDYYTITFDAALEWNGNYDMSPLYFAVNDQSENWLHIGNATETAKSNTYLDNTFKVREITLNTPIYLNKGTNTITLRMPKRYSNDGAFSVIDCVRLEGTDNVPIIGDKATLEVEDFVDDAERIKENEYASGGKVVRYNWHSEQTIVMNFIVTKTDYYELTFDAALEWGDKYEMSPLYFKVKDGEQIKLSTSNATRTEKENVYVDETFKVAEIRYNELVYLEAGYNSITLRIPSRGGTYNDGAFSILDCVRIESVTKSIDAAGGMLEAEDFVIDTSRINNNEYASGGKVVQYNWVGSEQYIQMDFNMQTSGYYTLIFDAALAWNGNYNMSPLYFTVNDNPEDWLHIGNATEIVKENAYLDSTFKVRGIKLNTPVFLNAGKNTISLRIPKREASDAVFGVIDCIKLEYNKQKITADNGGRIEAEAVDTAYAQDSASASSGAYVIYNNEPAGNEVSYKFDIKQAGKYKMVIAAAAAISNYGNELSPIEIMIDYGEVIALDDSNCMLNGSIYYISEDKTFEFGEYIYLSEIDFTKGEHSISILAGGQTAKYAIDYIDITPIAEIGEIILSGEKVVIAGQSTVLTITDGNGNVLMPEDVYSITYNTSDNTVLSVDATARVTGNNPGRAVITAAVRATAVSEELIAEFEIYVADKSGLYIPALEKADGMISCTVNAISGLDEEAYVIAAFYNESNQLISVGLSSISPFANNENNETIISIDNTTMYGTLYIWEKSSLKPIYKEVLR